MVSAARVEWVLRELTAGRQASAKVITYTDRMVIKLCLFPSYAPLMRNGILCSLMQSVLADMESAIVVDHGHKKSNGESHIQFMFRPSPTVWHDSFPAQPSGQAPLAEGIVPAKVATNPAVAGVDTKVSESIIADLDPELPLPEKNEKRGTGSLCDASGLSDDVATTAKELSSIRKKLRKDQVQEQVQAQVENELAKTTMSTQRLREMTDRLLSDAVALSAALTSVGGETEENRPLVARTESLVAKARATADSIPLEIGVLDFACFQEQVYSECQAMIVDRDQIIQDIEAQMSGTK